MERIKRVCQAFAERNSACTVLDKSEMISRAYEQHLILAY